jgi:hypothetical protein
MPEKARQLAKVAAITDELDKIIDRLFQNVADLKEILASIPPRPPGETKEETP